MPTNDEKDAVMQLEPASVKKSITRLPVPVARSESLTMPATVCVVCV